MEMVKIVDCSVIECAYNMNKQCHAMAITVGSECPMCETFTKGMNKGGVKEMTGGVGACRMDDCKFNRSLECNASGIHVGMHEDHAECDTYDPK